MINIKAQRATFKRNWGARGAFITMKKTREKDSRQPDFIFFFFPTTWDSKKKKKRNLKRCRVTLLRYSGEQVNKDKSCRWRSGRHTRYMHQNWMESGSHWSRIMTWTKDRQPPRSITEVTSNTNAAQKFLPASPSELCIPVNPTELSTKNHKIHYSMNSRKIRSQKNYE